jgi:hypothetical protein
VTTTPPTVRSLAGVTCKGVQAFEAWVAAGAAAIDNANTVVLGRVRAIADFQSIGELQVPAPVSGALSAIESGVSNAMDLFSGGNGAAARSDPDISDRAGHEPVIDAESAPLPATM